MIRMTPEADAKLKYGILDEASKLNLNVVPREVLLKLPLATTEIVDAIVDWRDSNETQEPAAGEADRGREDLERLASKLRHNGANLSRACAELGISRQRAYRLLEGRSVRELLAELGH